MCCKISFSVICQGRYCEPRTCGILVITIWYVGDAMEFDNDSHLWGFETIVPSHCVKLHSYLFLQYTVLKLFRGREHVSYIVAVSFVEISSYNKPTLCSIYNNL